ncbi:MAG: redoxin domain-containing protein [Pseudomonadales bacterium]
MVQLARWRERFDALGVNVAGMTYDDRSVLAAFHDHYQLGYPLLQDVDVKHFSAYGVRDEAYQPGDSGYGIPHPGILYVAPDGTVLLKFAVPGYRQRPPFEEVFDAVAALQAAKGH